MQYYTNYSTSFYFFKLNLLNKRKLASIYIVNVHNIFQPKHHNSQVWLLANSTYFC